MKTIRQIESLDQLQQLKLMITMPTVLVSMLELAKEIADDRVLLDISAMNLAAALAQFHKVNSKPLSTVKIQQRILEVANTIFLEEIDKQTNPIRN